MPHFQKGKAPTFVVLALSIFVFLFALNAKLALCYPAGPEHSRTAFKLYLNGQRLEVADSFPDQHIALSSATWLVFFTLPLVVRPLGRVTPSDFQRLCFRMFAMSHFFRPPPPALIFSF